MSWRAYYHIGIILLTKLIDFPKDFSYSRY